LIEAVGTDVTAAAFDTGNVICRGEDPLAAARRMAPHTRLTHVKDAILVSAGRGTFTRWLRPCGQGFIDWSAMLDLLSAGATSDLTLTLEDNQNPKRLEFGEATWRAAHPDLADAELATLVARTQRDGVDDESRPRWTRMDRLQRLTASRDALLAL
jgi:sugar phosphate isomerase/epimerase